MKTKIALSLMLLWFAGCQQKSEIDKCVEAHINRICNDVQGERGCREYTATNHEPQYREQCLRAQAGKE